MSKTIYENNDVVIHYEVIDHLECKIFCNNDNLIWIEERKLEDFRRELTSLLDRYRI